MNRYQGNTGRVTRVPDPAAQHRSAQRPAQTAPPPRQPAPAPVQKTPPMGTGGGLDTLLSGLLPGDFELEDALLLLILFLIYRETGDREMLIIMGAMFLM